MNTGRPVATKNIVNGMTPTPVSNNAAGRECIKQNMQLTTVMAIKKATWPCA